MDASGGTIPRVSDLAEGARGRRTWLFVLAGLWLVVFLLGAAGELFEIDFLRRATDLKRVFLR